MLTVAFDADDTLWHNEDHFQSAQRSFEELLAPWADAETVSDLLHDVQMANLARFGYGAKAFTLSKIEAAVKISGGEIESSAVLGIIDRGKALLDRPVELLEGVPEVLDALGHHRLMVITKGDLKDQLTKMEESGLADRFWQVEVVPHKKAAVYAGVLERHGIHVDRFVMVGNSLPSDVLPVLEIGGRAVHVPYHLTWRHEQHESESPEPERGRQARQDGPRLDAVVTLDSLRELPGLLEAWVPRAGGPRE